MATSAITKTLTDRIRAADRERFIWDDSLPGFGLRVQPSGAMTFILKYRFGPGRKAQQRRMTLGAVSKITATEARTLAKKILGRVANGEDPAGERTAANQSPTLSDLAEKFLSQHAETKRAKSTAKSYRETLEGIVLPRLGSKKAVSVTADDVQRLQNKLKDRPYQANRVVRILSSLYNYAAKTKDIPEGHNPCRGIDLFKEEGRERYLTSAELAQVGEALREAETVGLPYKIDPANPKKKHAIKPENRRIVIGPHAAAAIRLLIFTGARLREILHLQWDQIDFERGILNLPTSKTGKKTIVLNAPALSILSSLPKVGKFVIAGENPERPRSDLKKPWRAVATKAGFEGVRIHDLRHTHASVGVGAGLGLPIIGKLLGHSQAATTERYAHLDNDPLKRASEHIGSHLAAAMGELKAPRANVTKLTRTKTKHNRRG